MRIKIFLCDLRNHLTVHQVNGRHEKAQKRFNEIKKRQSNSKVTRIIHSSYVTLKKSKNPTSGALPTCFSLSLKKNHPVMPASSSSGFALDRETRWRRSSRLSRPRKNARPVLLIQGGPGESFPNVTGLCVLSTAMLILCFYCRAI